MTPVSGQPRRSFLKAALAVAAAPALWLMNRMADRAASIPEAAQVAVTAPWDPRTGVRFFEQFITVTTESGVRVFSSTCTHLGCRIDHAEDGQLVCPCHGSRFSLTGSVVRGPASRALQPLKFEIDRGRATMRVFLRS